MQIRAVGYAGPMTNYENAAQITVDVVLGKVKVCDLSEDDYIAFMQYNDLVAQQIAEREEAEANECYEPSMTAAELRFEASLDDEAARWDVLDADDAWR